MSKIVISGVNITQGGILSILQDCLASLNRIQNKYKIEVTVLTNNKDLIKDFCDNTHIKVLEYPKIKSSWFRRLHFEYVYSKKLSKELKADIWISLHDITPNVSCNFQVVYCHNASSFYKPERKYFFYDLTFSMFNLFYKYLYRINIHRNAYVIIQQNWLRETFKKLYNVNTIVAYPLQSGNPEKVEFENIDHLKLDDKKIKFFYPSIPRVFKNFEIICEAAQKLSSQTENFEVILTLDGSENKYANFIFNKYKHLEFLKFIGIQKRSVIQSLYNKADCLVFPSKLETWGLPISEFKVFNKPILVSDMPYAHENIGNYDKVKFFDPLNATQLAEYMLSLIENKLTYDYPKPVVPNSPFFESWDDLLSFLIERAGEK